MGLLKHAQNFIITKNKDTVKLNFCKIEYSFIVTEINHYCETTRGDINFWKASFLIAQSVHFDIWNKMEKKNFFSATKISCGGVHEFFWQEIF